MIRKAIQFRRRAMAGRCPRLALWAFVLVGISESGSGQEYERDPIRWSETKPTGDVAELQRKIGRGELSLPGEGRELLEELLEQLDVPMSSQVLVFSRTSLQRSRISPQTPRAIYFNDRAYVGWVPGGAIELATMDPRLGIVFYLVERDPAGNGDAGGGDGGPRFVRDRECMSCHGGMFIRGIPGLFARSVIPSRGGNPLLRYGSEIVDHKTPFHLRWGGWYVTGTHGEAMHRGNVFAEVGENGAEIDFAEGANREDLSELVDLSEYPEDGSDIVALMVLEHQMAMHNALTRAMIRGRRMIHHQAILRRQTGGEIFGNPETETADTEEPMLDSVVRVLDDEAGDVVDCLLYKGEAELPAGGVQGDDAFIRDYTRVARRDSTGRSLRDFNLNTRLMKHRCSPLIHSELFAALPNAIRKRIYDRLERALDPVNADPRYDYLGASERRRIVRILRETHDGLPEDWLAKGQ